jgi:hypothetical protein
MLEFLKYSMEGMLEGSSDDSQRDCDDTFEKKFLNHQKSSPSAFDHADHALQMRHFTIHEQCVSLGRDMPSEDIDTNSTIRPRDGHDSSHVAQYNLGADASCSTIRSRDDQFNAQGQDPTRYLFSVGDGNNSTKTSRDDSFNVNMHGQDPNRNMCTVMDGYDESTTPHDGHCFAMKSADSMHLAQHRMAVENCEGMIHARTHSHEGCVNRVHGVMGMNQREHQGNPMFAPSQSV